MRFPGSGSVRRACAGAAVLAVLCLASLGVRAGAWNNPYPVSEREQALVYESFSSRPKHLDPAQSYVEDEAWFVYSIYEPLYDYHYLKRPYVLQPNVAEAMPQVSYRDAEGNELPADAPVSSIAKVFVPDVPMSIPSVTPIAIPPSAPRNAAREARSLAPAGWPRARSRRPEPC